MQKGGDDTFTSEEVAKMLENASKEIKKLFAAFDKALK